MYYPMNYMLFLLKFQFAKLNGILKYNSLITKIYLHDYDLIII